ncbi:MAG: sulfatase-like hydrolase/transferase, partial [Chloroflexota bacterium]
YKDEDAHREKPFFAFLNLMEAHLPFYPPKEYLEKVNPDIAKNPNARKVMQQWNNEAYRWSCPLPEGLTDFEDEVLNTYYDAEVAFQDAFLDKLLKKIAERSKDRETLTIIVGDHGDGIGEHNYFGHAFVAYQELIHVPLIMHWPQKIEASQRVAGPVSTRRIFHTILSAAQVTDQKITTSSATEIAALSLKEVTQGRDVENETVYSEVYPPFNFIKAIADRQPDIVDQFRLNQMRRAIVQADTKLIQVDDAPDEMFNLKQDILEIDSILEKDSKLSKTLNQQLNRMVGTLESQRDNLIAGVPLELEQDPQLLEHLRGLGYID